MRAANKIKKKYLRKKIGKKTQHKNDSSAQKWVKNASYLNTKDQDSINYMHVQPSKNAQNSVQVQIDLTDLKKTNLVLKKKRRSRQQQKNAVYF